jgi:ABC-type multidrug transport system ATPase subunit
VAIDDVNFDLHQSEILGLVGVEGAGKTTLLQCASGLLRPDSGTVIARERRIDSAARPVVSYVPAIPIYYPFLTVSDVVALRASRVTAATCDAVDEALSLVGLYVMRGEIIATLSPSELLRLSLAESIVTRPVAMMVDTSGTRPLIDVAPVQQALSRISSTGTAVVVAVRDVRSVTSIATRIEQISDGCLVSAVRAPSFVAETLH